MLNYNPTSPVLFDKNKESWLAIEDNIIRVFTTKESAVLYREENKDKVKNVLHRYSDGTMQPLLCWPEDSTLSGNHIDMIIIDDPLFDQIEDMEELDFYDLVAANDVTTPDLEEPKE